MELLTENGEVTGVVTALGAVFRAKKVILATGTYLKGRIYVGDVTYEAGPDNQRPAAQLSESLRAAGIKLRRFKTGTPARIKKSSIDFTNLEVQEGDEPIVPFSFETDPSGLVNRQVCHVTYTNEAHPSGDPGEPAVFAPVQRQDRGCRPPVLSEHRG